MRQQARVIESGEIFQGDEEVIIAHGERRYRLSATRSGRLTMPGASPALRRVVISTACFAGLFVAYFAGMPMFAVACEAFLPPAAHPAAELAFIPAAIVYDHSEAYESYFDHMIEWMDDVGFPE